MLFLALLLALVALWLLLRTRRQQQAAGLPRGRVIYTDTRSWGPVEEPLYDPGLALTGRPDYLVKQGAQLIPVEVKSGRTPDFPFEGHIFQLAAYCLLVQRALAVRPDYGIIHYPNRAFAVDYTQQLESEILDLLAEIRRWERKGSPGRSHESPARCNACGFRAICDQRLDFAG